MAVLAGDTRIEKASEMEEARLLSDSSMISSSRKSR